MTDEQESAPTEPQSEEAGTLWIFVHIPKTAGSSFRTALAEQLQPNYNINIDSVRDTKPRDVAFAEEIEKFIQLDKEARFSFASGHIKMNEAVRIRDAINRPVKFITMLRDPVQRVISEYRYQRTPAHPGHEEFCRTYPTIENFVDDTRSQNKMFRHLALRQETPQDAITRIETDFAFVGVVELYPLAIKQCSKLTGKAISEATRVRVTETTDANAIELSDELKAKIKESNALDDRLWKHFRDRMRQVRLGAGKTTEVTPSIVTPHARKAPAADKDSETAKPRATPRPAGTPANLGKSEQTAEITRLKRENERLRMERDTLMKSIAIISRTR